MGLNPRAGTGASRRLLGTPSPWGRSGPEDRTGWPCPRGCLSHRRSSARRTHCGAGAQRRSRLRLRKPRFPFQKGTFSSPSKIITLKSLKPPKQTACLFVPVDVNNTRNTIILWAIIIYNTSRNCLGSFNYVCAFSFSPCYLLGSSGLGEG